MENLFEILMRQATKERDETIAAAHLSYAKAKEHIRWVAEKAKGVDVSKPQDEAESPEKNAVTTPPIVLIEARSHQLSDAIRAALSEMTQFTMGEMMSYLDSSMPELRASHRETTMATALSRMIKNGEVEVVRKGKRGQSQIYRKAVGGEG